MKKFILSTALLLTVTGCAVGPPYEDERARRAHQSLNDVDGPKRTYVRRYEYDYGYYDDMGRWHRTPYNETVVYVDDDRNDDDFHSGGHRWVRHNY